jgi:hypothetical protein
MPEIPPVPKTTKEAIIALWYTIHDGLSATIEETRSLAKDTASRMQGIESVMPQLWTREQHLKMHADYVTSEEAKARERGEQRKMSRRDVTMLWLVGAGLLLSSLFSLLALLMGK